MLYLGEIHFFLKKICCLTSLVKDCMMGSNAIVDIDDVTVHVLLQQCNSGHPISPVNRWMDRKGWVPLPHHGYHY